MQLAEAPRVGPQVVNLIGVASMKNHGHAVATNLSVVVFAYPQRFSNDLVKEPMLRQSERCRVVREQPIISSQSSIALFPDETASLQFAAAMDRPSIDAAAITSGPQGPVRLVDFMLAGCVDYTFPNSGTHHQTGFIYQVIRSTAGRERSIDLEGLYAGTIPPREFRLNRFFFGGVHVD